MPRHSPRSPPRCAPQADFKATYTKTYNKAGHAVQTLKAAAKAAVDSENERAWEKIDSSGDNSLQLHELADYYGFDLQRNSNDNMSDEQILESAEG